MTVTSRRVLLPQHLRNRTAGCSAQEIRTSEESLRFCTHRNTLNRLLPAWGCAHIAGIGRPVRVAVRPGPAVTSRSHDRDVTKGPSPTASLEPDRRVQRPGDPDIRGRKPAAENAEQTAINLQGEPQLFCPADLSNPLRENPQGPDARCEHSLSVTGAKLNLRLLNFPDFRLPSIAPLLSMCIKSSTGIELCPPGHRFMITMVASFIGMAGQFLLPGLAALCRDWQILQAVIICPFILMLSYWYIFPESLRWLMATMQFDASKKQILQTIHKNRVNTESDNKGVMQELERELARRPKKVCIVKVVGTRNLWKNILVLCVNSLTGYGIHHCFAKSLMDPEVNMNIMHNFYANYFAMAGITLASCLAMCPVVGFLGRRGGLLLFMILTALASLLQLGLLNLIGKYAQRPDMGMSETVKNKFSVIFSIIGMFSSHAVGSLSVFFCAEITPTVIRYTSASRMWKRSSGAGTVERSVRPHSNTCSRTLRSGVPAPELRFHMRDTDVFLASENKP
ncbi:unnamed protein product [Ranitomeya imitator]|uniref:Solute carrier family 22 member 23 n=1 Tax=Ranitomeya imitator TaxID=111125 RepID=A0ABN9LH16_9NEOB|nr:unnamed protein product [Ranitomeya imitator]